MNNLTTTGIPTTHLFGPKNGYTWNPVRGCANLECFLHPKNKGGCWAARDCNWHAIPWARAEAKMRAIEKYGKYECMETDYQRHLWELKCGKSKPMYEDRLKSFIPLWFESQFQKDFPKRRSCIFVFSQTDFAYLPDDWVNKVLNKIRVNNEERIIAGLPQHIFPFLTKKPDVYWRFCFPDNCWLGFTATTTMEYGDRLDGIFSPFSDHWDGSSLKYAYLEPWMGNKVTEINIVRELYRPEWVIVGGQSGKNAQPLNPAWVRSIRDQCVAAGIPFFFKSWGKYFGTNSKDKSQFMKTEKWLPENLLDGRIWEQFPEVK